MTRSAEYTQEAGEELDKLRVELVGMEETVKAFEAESKHGVLDLMVQENLERIKKEIHTILEISTWIYDFKKKLDELKLDNVEECKEAAIPLVTYLTAENPTQCYCDAHSVEKYPVIAWKHNNHARLNRILYWLVQSREGLLEKLRLIIDGDVRAFEGKKEAASFETDLGGDVRSETEMLNHFLLETPDQSWMRDVAPRAL